MISDAAHPHNPRRALERRGGVSREHYAVEFGTTGSSKLPLLTREGLRG